MTSNEQRRKAAQRKLKRQLARRAERERRRRRVTVATTIVVVVALALGAVYFLQAGQPEAAPQQPDPGTVNCDFRQGGQPAAKPVALPANTAPTRGIQTVTLNTTQGPIPVTVDRAKAPCAAQNFVHLAQAQYYNDTACHRLSTDGMRMLQCGDPTGTGSGGPGYEFRDEVVAGQSYLRGTVAMANSGPNTNGSQFFMVFGNSPLPPNYTVFGSIDEAGLGVLDRVGQAGHDNSGGDGTGKPVQPVRIQQALASPAG